MRGEDRGLADVAASVADGDAIDWQAAESTIPQPQRSLVRQLRLVETISRVYRTLPELSEADWRSTPTDRIGQHWGHLILLEQIGHGTSCEVYRALDTELHRDVALKLLHNDSAASTSAHRRVMEEARRLARVEHPNIVRVYGAEQHDGRVGLWMELVRGKSLDEIVRAGGRFSPAEAALIGRQMCAALAAVHGAGLLHRDVKAQNVMRDATGRTVLMDFGTGELLRDNTGSNRFVGTPLYLAPEIFEGRPATPQSDIYSLGVMLFYLVTGEHPQAATTMEQLADAHGRRDTRRLMDLRPELPKQLASAIERALDRDPEQRYRTAVEMETALRLSVEAAETLTRQPRRRFSLPNWQFRAAAALVVAVGLLLALLLKTSWNTQQPTQLVRSIAVLPIVDLSASGSAPHLADAMTDELIATLGRIQALQVTPRTSIVRFKNTDRSVPDIAALLAVDAILEASMKVEAPEPSRPALVRVNARLIAAGWNGSTMWSGTFDRPMGEMLVLQSDIAQSLAREIRVVLTEREQRRFAQTKATSPAADEAYFRGLYHLGQLSASHARLALSAFRRAVDLDSSHAAARAGLARGYITLGFLGAMSQPEARALSLAEATIAAREESSDAYAVLGDIRFYYDWDWSGAEDAYRRALALNDSLVYARTQYARYLAAAGRLDQAAIEAKRATEQDPLSASAFSTLGLIRYYQREHSAALQILGHAIELDPDSAGVYFVLSRAYAAHGSIDEAIAANERAIELSAEPATGWRAHSVQLKALAGTRSETERALQQLIVQTRARNEHLRPAHLAYIQIALGHHDAALQLLRKAADDRAPDLLWLGVDPRVDGVRNHPDFPSLLRRVGIPAPSVRQ